MGKKIYIVAFVLLGLIGVFCISKYFFQDPFYLLKPGINVEKIVINNDKDKDGILDLDDILQGARKEIHNKTKYKSSYYVGGYPPENEGVCTDVIWRALKNAGYDLKYSMDRDIKNNPSKYWRSIETADPNIDFRRVKNQFTFFKGHAINLTLNVIPYNKENLQKWQRGDIVVLENPDHVAIVSDKRRKDGVPYVIHNSYSYPKENDRLMQWYKQKRIIGHFRYIQK